MFIDLRRRVPLTSFVLKIINLNISDCCFVFDVFNSLTWLKNIFKLLYLHRRPINDFQILPHMIIFFHPNNTRQHSFAWYRPHQLQPACTLIIKAFDGTSRQRLVQQKTLKERLCNDKVDARLRQNIHKSVWLAHLITHYHLVPFLHEDFRHHCVARSHHVPKLVVFSAYFLSS